MYADDVVAAVVQCPHVSLMEVVALVELVVEEEGEVDQLAQTSTLGLGRAVVNGKETNVTAAMTADLVRECMLD